MKRSDAAAGLAAIGGACTLVLLLAGCGWPGPDEPASPSAPGATVDSAAATRFSACLEAAGVEALLVGDEGRVYVEETSAHIAVENGITSVEVPPEQQGRMLARHFDDAGRVWIAPFDAADIADDPGGRDAWQACATEHPDFAQPVTEPPSEAEIREEQARTEANALEFARCARDAGFAWVEDPRPGNGGAIELPLWLEESEFRSLLRSCGEAGDLAFGWMIGGELGFDWNAVLLEFTDQGQ